MTESVFIRGFIAMASPMLSTMPPDSPSARAIKGPSPLVMIPDEPPPRLVIDPPLAEPLSRGLVFLQYRTENMRVVPVFGQGALGVSPRLGHVHITVDDAPWHFVEASGETIIVVGLPPGEHRVLVELADPTHHVVDRQIVRFRLPDRPPPAKASC